MLRLSVEPGGCSGFSYKFEMADVSEVEEEDTCVHTPFRSYPKLQHAYPNPNPNPQPKPHPQPQRPP
jgi:hypothetical protein